MPFRINKQGAVIDRDCLGLTKALKKITPQEFTVLVLWLSYRSKYKSFPEPERKRKALLEMFGDTQYPIENNPLVLDAIEEYRSLQYDVRYETINAYQTKIAELTQKLIVEQSEIFIEKIDKAIEVLRSRCKEMQKEIDSVEDEIEIKAGGRLSKIERWQLNMVAAKKAKIQSDKLKRPTVKQILKTQV